jgi:hypothetical protein
MQKSSFSRLAIVAFTLAAAVAASHAQTAIATVVPAEVTAAQNQVISDLQALKDTLTQFQADKAANVPTAADLNAVQATRQTLQKDQAALDAAARNF